MSRIQTICVYLGSQKSEAFVESTRDFAREMARRGLNLVYGGASVGLMRVLADAVLEAGARVHGVIPASMVDREIAHQGLTQLDVVNSMHERKERMMELSDAFVLLPGGLGSLEEIFEAITWRQLQIHDKPTAVLNTSSYYDQLLAFLERSVADGFVKRRMIDSIVVASQPVELLDELCSSTR